MNTRPIFVIGNPRSGTSLLRLVLASHSRIIIPPECGFAIWWLSKYRNWRVTDNRLSEFMLDLSNSRKIETWKLDYAGLQNLIQQSEPKTYSQLVSLVYEYYCHMHGQSSARWGDKNNFHIRHIREIRELFPNACFVHIVRDGRDVLASYRELMMRRFTSPYAPRLPVDACEVAREWCGNLLAFRSDTVDLDGKTIFELRYEDFVREPREAVEKLCTFLGEEFERGMLEYWLADDRGKGEPDGFMEWKALTRVAPTTSKIGRYGRELAGTEIAAFERIAGPMLAQYGYL